MGASGKIRNGVVIIDSISQKTMIQKRLKECYRAIVDYKPSKNGLFCHPSWDSISCWPETPAGTLANQSCADDIAGFMPHEYATKECTSNGTWFHSTWTNTSWSNYSSCVSTNKPSAVNVSEYMQDHVRIVRTIYNIGYGVSLISLVMAVIIMLTYKKLHCPRNIVHINLFISFILRATISFLRDLLFVGGLGLAHDFYYDTYGHPIFEDNILHWECKTIMTLFIYIISANYMWIFVEALYLHMLIFVSVFSESSSVKRYVALGWFAPLSYMIPWTIARSTLEDTYCWNIDDKGLLWIYKAPTTVCHLVNFVFFVNIIRVLFTKLQASNTPEARRYRYIKLAKSTLVLIPLFGVHYIVFLALPEDFVNEEEAVVAKLYFEMFFNSFQGFIVALLFCFMNGEVRSELRKTWQRFQLGHGDSSQRGYNRSLTVSTYMARGGRNSTHSCTCNSAMERPESLYLVNGTYASQPSSVGASGASPPGGEGCQSATKGLSQQDNLLNGGRAPDGSVGAEVIIEEESCKLIPGIEAEGESRF